MTKSSLEGKKLVQITKRGLQETEFPKKASQAKTQPEVKSVQQCEKPLKKSSSNIYSTAFTKNTKISKFEAGFLVQATLEHKG